MGRTAITIMDYRSVSNQLVAGGFTYDSGIANGYEIHPTYYSPVIWMFEGPYF
jgi:hypothetical protein